MFSAVLSRQIIRWHLVVLGVVITGFAIQLFAHATLQEDIIWGRGNFGLMVTEVHLSVTRSTTMFLAVGLIYLLVVSKHLRNMAFAVFFSGALLNALEVSLLGRVNDFIVLPWFWEEGFGIYYCSVGDVCMTLGALVGIPLVIRQARILRADEEAS